MGEMDASYPCIHEWWLSFSMAPREREKTKKERGNSASPSHTAVIEFLKA
jgi:hypothetical protein